MGPLRVFFLGLEQALALEPIDQWGLISIRDPQQTVKFKHRWKYCLPIEFADSEYSVELAHFTPHKIHCCIHPQQASQIKYSVLDWVNNRGVNTIYCHSNNYRRAASVARYIADMTGARLTQDASHCNAFVYGMLKRPEHYEKLLTENFKAHWSLYAARNALDSTLNMRNGSRY